MYLQRTLFVVKQHIVIFIVNHDMQESCIEEVYIQVHVLFRTNTLAHATTVVYGLLKQMNNFYMYRLFK